MTEKKNKLPVKYEELNAVQFIDAVKKAQSTCIIPLGVLEKHGPHLPLGTDLMNVRELVIRAAEKEYTIVFPEYYFGQIFEAMHQPGTIAYSHEITWKLLQETCDELSRNEIKKIILANGHGGNDNFLKYFCQTQLGEKKDYIVYLFIPGSDEEVEKKLKEIRKTTFDEHAGEIETSLLSVHRPDLIQLDKASSQNGTKKERLMKSEHIFSGISWYANYPNHYAGNGQYANPEIGRLILKSKVEQLVEMIQAVKKDRSGIDLQKRFFDEAEKPLKSKQ